MKLTKHALLLLIALTAGCLQMRAQKTEIKGTVLDDDGEPALSVIIRDTDENGKIYGTTDYDGHFRIQANPATSLHFSGLTYMPKVVKLKGKTTINVVLSYESQKLDEVVVVARRIVNKFTPEPTDIEVVGNQYIIHPKVRIPREMFKPDTRIVVQPILINRTRNSQRLFSPAVVTGKQYAILLERMMEFDLSKDPLSPYYRKTLRVNGNEVLAYTDSLYMVSKDDDYRCDIYMYLVDYRKVLHKDSVTIAKGSVNPMRFFEYRTTARSITDNRYLPRHEMQLRGDKGEVSLTFVVNKAQIDDSDPNNAIELEKMRRRLLEVQNSPDTEFRSFVVTGVSSPEGNYAENLKLARRRTLEARNKMFGCLRPATVNALRDSISTGARVETWETIAGWMRGDSLPTEGLEAVISRYPGDWDRQYQEIRQLPDYPVIARDYLPRSRRVEYGFTYLVLRLLTDEEIRRMYEEDYRKLTKYEFWRLCSNEKNDSLKEEICRRALIVYPEFMPVANELAVLLLNKEKADIKLLEPYVSDQAPVEILNNQVAALLARREFTRADSVAGLMPDNPHTDEIRAIAHAFNGHYREAYEHLASKGGINEVVLLLAMKRNAEAWEKAQALPDDEAKSYYLRAVCANRTDRIAEAITFLKQAVARDPELKNEARIDGDVSDLVEQLDEQGKEKQEEGGQRNEK